VRRDKQLEKSCISQLVVNMETFAIHIVGNQGTVNVDFVERNYKLLDDEILIGRNENFPTTININKLLTLQNKAIDNAIFDSFTLTTKPSAPYFFDLKAWILSKYPAIGDNINKGISFEIDFYFKMNHYYENTEDRIVKHYALTSRLNVVFSAYKSMIAGEGIKTGNWYARQTGKWVEYKSDVTPYESILAQGDTTDDCLEFDIVSPVEGDLKIKIINQVNMESAFSNLPDYEVNGIMKIKAVEFSDYEQTSEIV